MRRLVALLSLVAAACALPEDVNPTPRCTRASHCPEAMRCYRSYCIEDEDATTRTIGIDPEDDARGRDGDARPAPDAPGPREAGVVATPTADAGTLPIDAGAARTSAGMPHPSPPPPASAPAPPSSGRPHLPPAPRDGARPPKPGGADGPTPPGPGGPGPARSISTPSGSQPGCPEMRGRGCRPSR